MRDVSTSRCDMRPTLAFAVCIAGFTTGFAYGTETSGAVQSELPTKEKIAEVCRNAGNQKGADPNLQAIVVRQNCTIQWPSFLILSTGCSAQSEMKKCIDDAFARSFPFPVGRAKRTSSYCRVDNCFDVYEVRDPQEGGAQRYDRCGYILTGKAMVKADEAYIGIADLSITMACLESPI